MQDHQMLDTVRSAGSTSSEAPTFSRGSMTKSLADELDGDFEDVELSPADSPERMEISNESNKEIAEETGRIDDGVLQP